MIVLFYISGHGFGHAARTIEVINALARLDPSVSIALRTSVPEWFLRASLEAPAEILPADVDTGVVQPDSLSIDEDETARRAASFYADFDTRVRSECALIRERQTTLVVGDIPPLAFAAARAAHVPSVAVSNFTWDWIYGGLPGFDRLATGVRDRIARANADATLTLRLPFAGGFAAMDRIEDVPLVARVAKMPRERTRAILGLPGDRPIALATFGGHGSTVNLDAAARTGRFLLVATDYEVGSNASAHPHLRIVSAVELESAGLSYTDLLAASDVVVTKLGYGIVSECVANGVAMLYALRGHFIEQDVFIDQMPAVVRCRQIDRTDLRAGRWSAAIEALLQQPKPSRTMEANGADTVARRLAMMST